MEGLGAKLVSRWCTWSRQSGLQNSVYGFVKFTICLRYRVELVAVKMTVATGRNGALTARIHRGIGRRLNPGICVPQTVGAPREPSAVSHLELIFARDVPELNPFGLPLCKGNNDGHFHGVNCLTFEFLPNVWLGILGRLDHLAPVVRVLGCVVAHHPNAMCEDDKSSRHPQFLSFSRTHLKGNKRRGIGQS